MNLNESVDNTIIFNTPIGFNVSDVFCDFTKKDLPKIEYIINQINWCKDKRGYQVHIGNHAWSLCMSRGEVTKILSRLVEHNIIAKASNHNAGVNSNGYVMIKPYTNETSIKNFYKVEDYLFMQKLQADKWVAKGKDHSAYIKPTSTDSGIVKGLQARVKELELLLTENGISIPPVVKKEETKIIQLPISQPELKIEKFSNLKFNEENNELFITDGQTFCVIEQFDDIKAIANELTSDEQKQMYEYLLNYYIPGKSIYYQLNEFTALQLNKYQYEGVYFIKYENTIIGKQIVNN